MSAKQKAGCEKRTGGFGQADAVDQEQLACGVYPYVVKEFPVCHEDCHIQKQKKCIFCSGMVKPLEGAVGNEFRSGVKFQVHKFDTPNVFGMKIEGENIVCHDGANEPFQDFVGNDGQMVLYH